MFGTKNPSKIIALRHQKIWFSFFNLFKLHMNYNSFESEKMYKSGMFSKAQSALIKWTKILGAKTQDAKKDACLNEKRCMISHRKVILFKI